jgi:toxin-antitoxin system PIN domain toxin
MMMPDVNVLIYAYDKTSKYYLGASVWLERVLYEEDVFFTWHTITGFIRIITSPTVFRNPITVETAVQVVDDWLRLDNTHLVELEKKTWPIFSELLIESQSSGNLVMDAHIAAVSKLCGGAIATTDRDFRRFRGITLIDPLSAK